MNEPPRNESLSLFNLPVAVRNLVRRLRFHLLQIYKKKPFDRDKSRDQMRSTLLKLLVPSEFKALSSARKKELVDIAIFDETNTLHKKPLAWEHEFNENHYPNLGDPADIYFKIAIQLDSDYALLYVDSLASLDKTLAEEILKRLTDISFIKENETKTLQALFRKIPSKILSDATKIADQETEEAILANVSKRVRQQLLKDQSFHDSLPSYRSHLACIEIVRYFNKLN